ncbi:AAEL005026-PA [Aedes aegypti]|nr:AAEL005026-PA [Aedes aegypti]
MFVVFLLLCGSGIDLGMVAMSEEDIPNVEPVTKAFNFVSYAIVLSLLFCYRKYGIQSSGTIFVFWFLRVLFGIPQARSEGQSLKHSSGYQTYHIYSYLTQYAMICISLVLEIFPDEQPTTSSYPPSKNPNPESSSSFLSRLLFLTYDRLLWTGFRKQLTMDDMYDLNPEDSTREISPEFDRYWNEHIRRRGRTQPIEDGKSSNGSILPVIVKAYWGPFAFAGVIQVFMTALQLASPYLLMALLSWITTDGPLWQGVVLALGLYLSSLMYALLNGQYYFNNFRTGFRIRTALVSAIYRKALRISNAAKRDSTIGNIVNLMAVDAQRFVELTPFLHLVWYGPLVIGICLWLLYDILGVAVFAGLGVIFLMMPLSKVISTRLKVLQAHQMKHKDSRVKKIHEVLSSMKVLKLYAWEPSFQRSIQETRDKELKIMKKTAFYGAGVYFVFTIAPFLVTLVTFTVYVLIDEENVLTAQKAFVSLVLFNIMKVPLSWLPMLVTMMMQARVSVKRLNKFMNSEELDETAVTHHRSEDALSIRDGNFSWGDVLPTLKNINLSIQKGQLCAVVGSVGCGKSSLLAALLGEMNKVSGSVNVDGSLVYVAQQAWIQNATVRDNVLFGKAFDQQKYDRVIECCALKADLKLLPAGDRTEIGEKGVNLSGGQKQRVALARAVYADAEIYLFDDPLSAVDVHVAEHIFRKVMGAKGILANKTRLLVTHGESRLPYIDIIFVMKNGVIVESGSYQELLDMGGEFSELFSERRTRQEYGRSLSVVSQQSVTGNEAVTEGESGIDQRKQSKVAPKSALMSKEESKSGAVSWEVYWMFLKAFGATLGFWTFAFSVLTQISGIFSSLWLSKWTEDPVAAADTTTRNIYLMIYGSFGILQSLSLFIGAVVLALGCLRASRNLHNGLLDTILRLPMSFYDATPIGRILNRFSKDVDVLDSVFPVTLRGWTYTFFNAVGVFVVIVISTPTFLAVVPFLFVVYFLIQKIYVASSRQLRRLESITKSPVLSHFEETFAGQSTIRAFGEQERFIRESEEKIDFNQKVAYPGLLTNRWMALRLEIVGAFVVFFAALLAVLARESIGPGIVGLSITYALQISATMSFMVRMTSVMETNVVAIERLEEYAELPVESKSENATVEKGWPQDGEIEFQEYKLRYREGTDLVIKGISLKVESGEKVGIVGRTGAGKSSLSMGLFRIVEACNGQISIDGIDISKVGLHQLRSRLTVIPQDPVLFAESIRRNLDPFEAYSDDQIWRALDMSHLAQFVKSLPNGLQHKVTENGENLSMGQRQLICLARAVLRKSKILILDEATAAVDMETDKAIQRAIRTEFSDCTVLTVAHRLNTIIDYDKIVVLENGTVAEYGTPQTLLEDKTSSFYRMVKKAGIIE